jgi:prepilin-type N-terminal cleavage/methylation domain-containing protein
MDRKGFTLTELLIVLAIISILVVISIPAYVGQQKRAARTEASANLETLRLLEEQFFAENATYAGPAANEAAITALLPGFRPGPGLSFNFAITSQDGVGLPTPVPVPYDFSTAPLANPNTPCFIATALGMPGTRVDSDVFAIDCNNNRNF